LGALFKVAGSKFNVWNPLPTEANPTLDLNLERQGHAGTARAPLR